MGRKRLIVQADLTSEEDQAFMAWVKQKLRRRKLAEEIRQGLRVQYERSTGQARAAYEYAEGFQKLEQVPLRSPEGSQEREERERGPSPDKKLRRLMQSF